MKVKHKTHNWAIVEGHYEGDKVHHWECTDCGIWYWEPSAYKRCLRFNMLVYLLRKISQFKKDIFYKAGMFLLERSR